MKKNNALSADFKRLQKLQGMKETPKNLVEKKELFDKLFKHAYTPPRTVAISKKSHEQQKQDNEKQIIDTLTTGRSDYEYHLIRLKKESFQMDMVSLWQNKRKHRIIRSFSRAHDVRDNASARHEAVNHARALLGGGSWTLIEIMSEVWRHYVTT